MMYDVRWRLMLLVALPGAVAIRDEGTKRRPISQADSVVAVYVSEPRTVKPSLIVAAWADGKIVWSHDRESGGEPYFSAKVDSKKVRSLITRLEVDGIFSQKDLNQTHFGPDAAYATLLVRAKGKEVRMESWYELYESGGKAYGGRRGIVALDGRTRLEALKAESAEFLFYRYVWRYVQSSITDLIPTDGSITAESPIIVDGELSWSAESDPDERGKE